MTLKLNKIDSKIYELIKLKKEIFFENILNELNFSENSIDNVRRSIENLKLYSLISEKTITKNKYELDINAKKALEIGFIEEIFCNYIKDKDILVSNIKQLDIENIDRNEISLAFGICKKKDLIYIKNGFIKVNDNFNKIITEDKIFLKQIDNGDFSQNLKIDEFLKRKNFLIEKQIVFKKYILNKIEYYEIDKEKILNLTTELLKNKDIKDCDLKTFDVEKLPKAQNIGLIHPFRKVMYYLRDLFIEMGFKEMKGPYVETCFWNMDSMFISQDHPARDNHDTFYLPKDGDLPNDENLLNIISKLHFNGADTGSKGYKYNWNRNVARKLILRTHTTATTFRVFNNLEKKENQKYFCIDKVFRNETIDATHLPEFHQAEGFVIGNNLGLSDLLGFIKEFLGKLGITKIKFKPNYNPYTEPSVEVFVYLEKQDKWIELLNAGVFRPETLKPYGIKQSVIAWGFGCERIAMLIYNKNIKELHGDECDLDWLRNYKIPDRKIQKKCEL
jgi:phenylalanyl-tRNA synthetase alpha chain